MRLSQKAIQEFKEIYSREFKSTISDQEAQLLGERLIALFRAIYRPFSNEKEEDIKTKTCKKQGRF